MPAAAAVAAAARCHCESSPPQEEGRQEELIESTNTCSCVLRPSSEEEDEKETERTAWCFPAEIASSSITSFVAASRLAHESLASAVQALSDGVEFASSNWRTPLLLNLVSLGLPDGHHQCHLSATCVAALSETLVNGGRGDGDEGGGGGGGGGACCLLHDDNDDVAKPRPSYRQVRVMKYILCDYCCLYGPTTHGPLCGAVDRRFRPST